MYVNFLILSLSQYINWPFQFLWSISSVKYVIITLLGFISMETKINQMFNDYPKATERNGVKTRNGILTNETAENRHFDRTRFHLMFLSPWVWVGSVYSNSEIIHWMNPCNNMYWVYCFGLWASYTSFVPYKYQSSQSENNLWAIYMLSGCSPLVTVLKKTVAVLITSSLAIHFFSSIYVQPSAPKFIVLVTM